MAARLSFEKGNLFLNATESMKMQLKGKDNSVKDRSFFTLL